MNANMARTVGLITLVACTAEAPPSLLGVVSDGRDGSPLVGAEITVVSPARGDVIGEATTGSDGSFEALLSRGADGVALEIRAEHHVTTVLHGNAPLNGPLQIEDGFLYAMPDAAYDALTTTWSGCSGADRPLGVVFGEMRVFDLVDQVTGESPITTEGQVDVFQIDNRGKIDTTWVGCYLDDAGKQHDPTAEFTGLSGKFAVFGVEPGFHEVRAQWQPAPNQWQVSVYPAWVPDGERAALPLWPAWVEFGALQ